ncbi:uncharacterized protein [Antedon mediterranea]|uniref:uncharacterized protein isoform X2 n=1 Tax=Antedon mediterranea TaxID=105859 RepID=UPI003AF99F9D
MYVLVKENVSCTDENGIFNADLFKEVPLLAKRYKYVKVLGRGISSILIQAVDTHRRDDYQVAIKILHTEYQLLGYQEADTVLRLNRLDSSNFSRVVKLLNTFQFGDHFCMVYELLRPNPLYEVISKKLHRDKKLKLIRKIAVQLLQVLGFLSQANVIHADLKPENILCCSDDISEGVKVVDFGNAIHCIFNELSLYYDDFQLQTILYRAPEVVFGLPFGPEIDMWSVGCILAELYIGEPLFPAKSSDFLLTRMIGLLGPLPASPFNRGKFHNDFIGYIGEKQPPHVTVNKIKHRLNGSPDFAFVTFLYGMLKYNPDERMTVSEAFQHAFIAPEVAGRFLLHGLKNPYSTLDIDASLYTKSPDVSADIAKECLTKVELLRRGTFRRAVAEVSPFISKKKSPRVNVHPQTVHTTQRERAVNRNDVAGSRDMDCDTTQQEREMDRGVVTSNRINIGQVTTHQKRAVNRNDVAGRKVDAQNATTQQERAANRNDVAGRRVDTQHDTTEQERTVNRNDVAGRRVDTQNATTQQERAANRNDVAGRKVDAQHDTTEQETVNRNDVAGRTVHSQHDTTEQERTINRNDGAGRKVDAQNATTQQERAANRNDVAGRRVDTQHDTTEQERTVNRNDVAGRRVDTQHDTTEQERTVNRNDVAGRRVDAQNATTQQEKAANRNDVAGRRVDTQHDTTQQERTVNRNDVAGRRVDTQHDTTEQERTVNRNDGAGRKVDAQNATTQQERAANRNDVAGRRVDTQHDTTEQERTVNRNDVGGRRVDTPLDTAQKERAMDTCVVPGRRVNACPQKPQTAPQASCAKHSRSLPSLNKKGRTRKPFEYFDKSRKNGLKNCLDGFKELENCDDLNSIYGNVNDPYDIDNIFNDVITPVKLHSEKHSQQKQNIKLKTKQCRKSLKIHDDNKEVAIPRKSPYSEKKRIEPELDLKNIGNRTKIAKSSLTTVNRKRKTLNSEIQFSDKLTTFTTENTLKIKKRPKLNDEEQAIRSPEVQRNSPRKNKGERILNSKLKHRNDMDGSKKSHQELEKHSTKKQSKTVNKHDKHKKEIKNKNHPTLNTDNCIDKDSSTSKTLKVKISNVSTVNSNVKQDSVEHFLQCKDSERDWFHVDSVKKRRRKEQYFNSQVEDDILLL